MDNLNNKMKECYNISSKVISKYNELYSIITNYYLEDSSIYELYISDILELINKEYKIYNTLTLTEINTYLNILNKIDNNNILEHRFKHMLNFSKNTFNSIKINKYILKLDIIPNNLNFDIINSLISFIDIKTMKEIKYKLDRISTDDYNDLSFINSMYKEFNELMLYQSLNNNLTEYIYLKSNMDIEKTPTININNLIKYINEIIKLEDDNYFIPTNTIIINLIKNSINKLVNNNFENNTKSIFDYLYFTTRIENLIEYINKIDLINLLNYCNELKYNNNFYIENIINIIKKRIK